MRIPASERTERSVTQNVCDIGQTESTVGEMPGHLLRAYALQQVAVAGIGELEPPLQRSKIDAEGMCGRFDRGAACGQAQHDRLLDFLVDRKFV